MKPLISVKWKDGQKWRVFDLNEINHMPRTHAINLFSNNIQVVAKQDSTYIVNRQSIKDQYESKNQPCKLFGELAPDDRPLQVCGFV